MSWGDIDWVSLVASVWNWVYNHFLYLCILGVVVAERKALWLAGFIQPIRGGNGVTQMDELAKYLILGLLVAEWATKRDPIIIGELLTGVFAIAHIQVVKKKKHHEASEH